jgi:hypothetical protein
MMNAIDISKRVLRSWLALEVLSPQGTTKGNGWRSWAEDKHGQLCGIRNVPHQNARNAQAPDLSSVPPWISDLSSDTRSSRPGFKRWYHLVLGALPSGSIFPSLDEKLQDSPDEETNFRNANQLIVAASLIISEDGMYVPSTLAISSFAWGSGYILSGNSLETLGNWAEQEASLVSKFSDLLTPTDESGTQRALQWSDLKWIADTLQTTLKIPENLWECLPCCVRTEGRKTPDGDILTSYFVEDLIKVRNSINEIGPALSSYLGHIDPQTKHDVLTNKELISHHLQPKYFPLASWPSPGRHRLTTLQQFAVNVISSKLKADGLSAVNGPPGTGQTTLLRDLVAHVTVQRAERISCLGKAYENIETLNLSDFSIVVASSNNKAVENVTLELPLVNKAFDQDIFNRDGFYHFHHTATALLSPGQPDENEDDEDAPVLAPKEQLHAWGLVAAKLGKSENRKKFVDRFFYGDYGIKNWLEEASGFTQDNFKRNKLTEENPPPSYKNGDALKKFKDACHEFRAAHVRVERIQTSLQRHFDNSLVMRRTASEITEKENKLDEVVAELELAWSNLASAKTRHSNLTLELTIIQSLLKTLEIEAQAAQLPDAEVSVTKARTLFNEAQIAAKFSEEQVASASKKLEVMAAIKPSWLARLLRTGEWRSYTRRYSDALDEFDAANAQKISSSVNLRSCTMHLKEVEKTYSDLIETLESEKRNRERICTQLPINTAILTADPTIPLLDQIAIASRSLSDTETRVRNSLQAIMQAEEAVRTYGESHSKLNSEIVLAKARYSETEKSHKEEATSLGAPDRMIWTLHDNELQRMSPWNSKEFKEARDELYVAAVKLHYAYIGANARQMLSSLKVVISHMNGSDAKKPPTIHDWGVLFLFIPVISTTFHSIGRMFASLGREDIGWLFIDEAGQGAPQQAVGAIWRSKRAVVIGDPLQIQPITTMPKKTTKRIFQENGIQPDGWIAPTDSVQTLADRTSEIQGHFPAGEGKRIAGIPLLVHRRCQDPMFSISNSIAYADMMIHEASHGHSNISEVLGGAAWVHIKAPSQDKWVQAEGELITKAISELFLRLPLSPDIYVISPFRSPAFRLKNMMTDAYRNKRILPHMGSKEFNTWLNDRVGTVHTFQGKEADSVILMLGCGDGGLDGSRLWAGGEPNLLNVAATRAKRNLYVVGDITLWGGAGHFEAAQRFLPKIKASEWIKPRPAGFATLTNS